MCRSAFSSLLSLFSLLILLVSSLLAIAVFIWILLYISCEHGSSLFDKSTILLSCAYDSFSLMQFDVCHLSSCADICDGVFRIYKSSFV